MTTIDIVASDTGCVAYFVGDPHGLQGYGHDATTARLQLIEKAEDYATQYAQEQCETAASLAQMPD